MVESEWRCRFKIHCYPFSQDEPTYESCYDVFDALLGRISSIDEFVKRKLMEQHQEAAEIIRKVDEINGLGWVNASVKFYDVEVWLTKDEWMKIVSEAVKVLKFRAALLEEHIKKLGGYSE